jgi:hypothetical protein
MGVSRIVVFVGPSIPVSEARAFLPAADFRPPVRKGDIYRLLVENPRAIVLIDGVFHAEPSVWQREVIAALDDGIPVYGSSSMGALRGAECQVFGMVGHGAIYEWYRDGRIDGDDEVALRHGDGDSGWRSLSEPLVNIRATLDFAVASGVLSASEGSALAEEAKATYYPDRTLRRLPDGKTGAAWSVERREQMRTWFATNRVDQKRRDAESLLSLLSREPPSPQKAAETPVDAYRARFLSVPDGNGGRRTRDELLAELRKRPALLSSARQNARSRWFALDLARQRGLALSDAEIECAIAAHGAAHPVADRSAWLRSVGLSRQDYRRALRDRALADGLLKAEGAKAVLHDWAARAGAQAPDPADDVGLWLLRHGPSRMGRFPDEIDLMLRELQLDGRIVELLSTAASA